MPTDSQRKRFPQTFALLDHLTRIDEIMGFNPRTTLLGLGEECYKSRGMILRRASRLIGIPSTETNDDTMSVRNTFQLMKDLLSTPDKWTTEAMARDKNGNSCSALSPEAHCFCLLGAKMKVLDQDFVAVHQHDLVSDHLYNTIAKFTGGQRSVDVFNDCLATFENIHQVLDLAIKTS